MPSADLPSIVRVWVAAPSPAVRAGLRSLLEREPRLRVTAETATVENFPSAQADVLVLAVGPAGIAVQSEPLLPVVLLTAGEGREPGIPPWVRGVLSMEADADELAAAVLAVSAGLWVSAPGVAAAPWEQGAEEDQADALTDRELEVLALMARGLTNRQIAAELVLSENTVKFHAASMYAKLRAGNRAQAVRAGLRRGLVEL